jgi:chorismate mutase
MDDKIHMDIAELSTWNAPMRNIFLIAGPCSAESEEQLVQTAQGLRDAGISMLRAGIWKPRTRPNCFEGKGEEALPWLKAAGQEAGVPTCCEVASPEHVEACLRHGIDALWIGARTSVNPFSVQAVADALTGVDIPVLVKNPINPDIELWIGALERVHKAGIRRLAAIHRGFSQQQALPLRNKPNWRLAIELMRRIPNLPMICDPSHICGCRELQADIAQRALNIQFDGLMVEVHRDPAGALSDCNQQFTPDDFRIFLKGLVFRRPGDEDQEFRDSIQHLRERVDILDSQLLDLLAQRMKLARKIAEVKKTNNVAILQPERWNQIVETRLEAGATLGLSEHFILRLFQYIHQESIRQQEDAVFKRPNSHNN